METIQMIQKATAVGSWWLAVSSRQCAHSRITSCTEFIGETSSHPVDSAPYDFWLFLKLKSSLKGKRFQSISEVQENTMAQLMATGKTVWGPKVPALKGTEASLSYVQDFLYLVSSSINVSVFHSMWLDTFWTYFALSIRTIYLSLI